MKHFSKILAFFAVGLTGVSAGVAFAHLLELPNKMKLSADNYLQVQQTLYEGFGQILGPIELGAGLSAIALTVLWRKQPLPFRFGVAASICIATALAIWQFHNGPVNTEVDGWTLSSLPTNWMTYRDRWEYAHAARAGFYILGLSALITRCATFSLISQFACINLYSEVSA